MKFYSIDDAIPITYHHWTPPASSSDIKNLLHFHISISIIVFVRMCVRGERERGGINRPFPKIYFNGYLKFIIISGHLLKEKNNALKWLELLKIFALAKFQNAILHQKFITPYGLEFERYTIDNISVVDIFIKIISMKFYILRTMVSSWKLLYSCLNQIDSHYHLPFCLLLMSYMIINVLWNLLFNSPRGKSFHMLISSWLRNPLIQ